jgi:leader peptidase (prepilin peptidase)/N-methyltransferase
MMALPAEFMAWYGPVVSLVVGLCIGSFLNVIIFRLPEERSIVRPRSHCPGCGKTIAWYDNIPVVSYLLLGAKCRGCRMRISPRYPLVELLTGVLFVAIYNRFGVEWMTLVFWIMTAGLIVGTFVDFDHMIIPDSVSIGGMVFGVVASTLVPDLHGQATFTAGLLKAVVGLVAGFGSLWLVGVVGKMVFKKDAMGFGDVKLLGAIGALLGIPGVVYTVLVSSLIGTLVGVALILFGGREWQSRIPYGPYLALGALSWVLGGDQLWNWYVGFVAGG